METPHFILRPSPVRLGTAVAVQGGLVLLLLWIALAHPTVSVGWRLFLLIAAGLNGWSALSLFRARGRTLMLTSEELRDSVAGPVCRLAEIRAVDRGSFTLKPARGFALKLRTDAALAWAPGLWWRVGRTVGVGGMTGSAETRALAEMMAAMVAARAVR